jgi:MFS family permease
MRSARSTEVQRSLGRTLSPVPAFAVVSFSLGTLMAVAGVPAPLYGVYQQLYGVSSSGVTGSFAVYILMVAATLLTCGRLSDYIGRRAVTGAALILALASCVVLAFTNGIEDLLIGRAMQGASSGLAMSAVSAYVIDLQSPRRPALGATIASAGPTLGLALGAVISGALVQFAPRPTHLVYIVFGAVLLACLVCLPMLPDTAHISSGVLASFRPKIAVPADIRKLFVGVCACAVAVWALSGFYQSLGPALAVTQLHHDGQFTGGLVVASLVGPTVLGGAVSTRLRSLTAMLVGLATVVVAVAGVLTGLHSGSTALFFASSFICGCGFGCAFSGAMQTVLSPAAPQDRAGLISAVYLVSYFGAALPAYLAGVAEPYWGLEQVAIVYGCLVVVLSVLAMVLSSVRRWR